MTAITRGEHQNTSQAFVTLQTKITQKHSDDENFSLIRNIACGKEESTKKSFRRSRQKQYPVVKDFSEVADTQLIYTLRGLSDGIYKNEQQLLHADSDMIILSSPRLMQILARSNALVADGTFFYSPYDSQQVYRIFGFAEHNRHCLPVVTCILKRLIIFFEFTLRLSLDKDAVTYAKMWKVIADNLTKNGLSLSANMAFFDKELAAVKPFSNKFKIPVKMCSYHVKSNINKKVAFTNLFSHCFAKLSL